MGETVTEERLQQVVAANPYFGSWDEWSKAHYNHIPVLARSAMAHLYGQHDDVEGPYSFCVLCTTFRVSVDRSAKEALRMAEQAADYFKETSR